MFVLESARVRSSSQAGRVLCRKVAWLLARRATLSHMIIPERGSRNRPAMSMRAAFGQCPGRADRGRLRECPRPPAHRSAIGPKARAFEAFVFGSPHVARCRSAAHQEHERPPRQRGRARQSKRSPCIARQSNGKPFSADDQPSTGPIRECDLCHVPHRSIERARARLPSRIRSASAASNHDACPAVRAG